MATTATTAVRRILLARSSNLQQRLGASNNYSTILQNGKSIPCRSSSLQRMWWDCSRRWQTSYPSHEVVGMPSLSPTMEAGTIASWNLEEGESFVAGDVLCEIETDKATMAFEAQDDGVVAKILAESGPTEIQCGEPIMITVEEEDDADAFKTYVVEESGETSGADVGEVEVAAAVPAAVAASEPVAAPPVAVAPAPVASGGGSGARTFASPLAWSLANEKGWDLSDIAIVGTGPDGRVIADDVREYVPVAASVAATPTTEAAAVGTPPPAAALPPPVQHDGYTDYPLSASSIQSADLLTHSKQTVPHYYLTVDVTLDNLLALRARLNAIRTGSSEITLDDLLLKATACAMKSCPDANASWMGDTVRRYDSVDINYVMGNGQTMYAPRIAGVDQRGLGSISQQIAECLEKITPDEDGEGVNVQALDLNSEVGTVTVMNLGMYGVKSCAPIIREPQAVALALGAAENRMVPKEIDLNSEDDEGGDNYDVKVMLTATLSCDHRVVDGAVGAQWLSSFKAAVENPDILLL